MIEAPLSWENIAILNATLVQELNAAYMEELLEIKGFPDACCIRVSQNIANNYRLRYREGFFRLDLQDRKKNLFATHAWCEDAKKTIIDFVAYEFNPYLTKPLSRGLQIISPENPLYQRYVPLSSHAT